MSSLYSGIIPIIKQAALDAVDSTQPVNIVFGKVTSTSPIKIQISQKLTLGEGNLVIPDSLTKKSYRITINGTTSKSGAESYHTHDFTSDPYTLKITGTTEGGDAINLSQQIKISGTTNKDGNNDGHTHTFSDTVDLVIDNTLKVGDSVVLARIQGGSTYLVLDKAVNA